MQMRRSLRPVLARPLKPRQIWSRYNSSNSESPYYNFVPAKHAPHVSGEGDTSNESPPSAAEPASKLSQPYSLRRSFSGIQPTGIPHLGNYLGALRQWKDLQDQGTDKKLTQSYRHEQFFSVVDLHALTSYVPAEERIRLNRDTYAALLAIGLKNSENTTLFFQSHARTALSVHDRTGSDCYPGPLPSISHVDLEYFRFHRILVSDDSVEGSSGTVAIDRALC
jgi:hypothetical protein